MISFSTQCKLLVEHHEEGDDVDIGHEDEKGNDGDEILLEDNNEEDAGTICQRKCSCESNSTHAMVGGSCVSATRL